MRLARLAAAGLGVGLLVGFAAALLRPRPHAFLDGQTVQPHIGPATGIPAGQDDFDALGPAPRDPTDPRPDPATAGRPSAPAVATVHSTDVAEADARRLDR